MAEALQGDTADKPRLFISHSAKDFEPPAAPPAGTDEWKRLERLKFARAVRDKAVARLSPKFEILLDRKLLEPGDAWRAKLRRWLGTCDAALLLLDRESAKSEWVRLEATILTWRKSLRDSLLIVPVFLGDLRSGDAELKPLVSLGVSEIEAARIADPAWTDANADALTDAIVAKLDGFAGPASNVGNAMLRWIEDVAAQLPAMDKDSQTLRDARRELDISEEDWLYFQEREITFAHQLLHSPLENVYEALYLLKRQISREKFERLIELVQSTWVDAGAAAKLLAYTQKPVKGAAARAASSVLAINTERLQTARDYIGRAHCGEFPDGRVIEPPFVVGEGAGDEAAAELRQALLQLLRIDEDEEDPDAALKRRLASDPFVGLVKLDADRAELVRDVSGKFPLTWLVLAGRDFARLKPPLDTIAQIEPHLDPAAEQHAREQQRRLADLVRPPTPPR